MNKQEREAILQFMRLVFVGKYPNASEYPWAGMTAVFETTGKLADSPFGGTYMAEAFYMRQAIEKLENA